MSDATICDCDATPPPETCALQRAFDAGPAYTWDHPKWEELELQLTGENSNAFSILARFDRVLKKGVRAEVLTDEERLAALAQARDGNYDHLLWFIGCMVSVS